MSKRGLTEPFHPSAAEISVRAYKLAKKNAIVQSLALTTCLRTDAEMYLASPSSHPEPALKNRFRTGHTFPDFHDKWILSKLHLLPPTVEIFQYYSQDVGIALGVTGIYDTRVRVQWVVNSMTTTEEPASWLHDVSTNGPLEKRLYYGTGFELCTE